MAGVALMSPGVRCPRRTHATPILSDVWVHRGDGGRIVVPSTPIHDPITKRVRARYNRSRDPSLCLTTLPRFNSGGPTTPVLKTKNVPCSGVGRYLVDKRVERFGRNFSPRYGSSDARYHFRGKRNPPGSFGGSSDKHRRCSS